jgi:4-carboxymuconolactone decarboxylase
MAPDDLARTRRDEFFPGQLAALSLPGQSTTTPADRADTGLALERQIFGRETVDDFFATAPADQRHIQQLVAANLRVGNDRARLVDVLTQLLPYIGYPRMLNALRALNEALDL